MTTEQAVDRVFRILTSRTGLHVPVTRRDEVARSVARLALDERDTIESYAEKLERQQIDLAPLVEEVSVGETYFFREPGHFDFLRRLLGELRSNGRPVRIWSAGCASGEEPYSIAILLEQERIGNGRILATDISHRALKRARAASYSAWSFRGCSPEFIARYFEADGTRFVLRSDLRERVTFEHLNLALDVYPSSLAGTHAMDVIFLRNVLIYFDRQTVHEVARRLFEALEPGGWLITGPSDPLLDSFAPFEIVIRDEGVFHRRPLEQTAIAATTTSRRPSPPPTTQLKTAKRTKPPSRPRQRTAAETFAEGDYAQTVELTRDRLDEPEAAALYIRSLANIATPEDALRASSTVIAKYPSVPELQFLHAVMLAGAGRDDDAVETLRRVLYLDRSLAVAHFLFGTIHQRRGAFVASARAYRTARQICATNPPDAAVPLADGEVYGSMLHDIDRHRQLMSAAEENP